ncbi:hypothetical protein [Hydrotalea sp.]|uniref:hypothetical protein n=1 Tax=Hydrotalea sp. TaxID=2881279 RepID=UPI003D0CF4C4
MENIKISRKGIFPLRTLNINVNNEKYSLKGNEEITINLPSKEFNLNMKMDWWNSTKHIKMKTDENKIIIRYKFSDIYFFVGLTLLLILSVLTYLQITPINLIVIFVLVYVLLQIYHLIFKSNQFFEIDIV